MEEEAEEEKVAEERRGRTSPISCPGSELSSTNLDRSPIAYFGEIRKQASILGKIEQIVFCIFQGNSSRRCMHVLTNNAK